MVNKQKTTTKSGFNALVWQEDDLFVAKTIEVELASQGKSSKEALANLEEAIELYFENEKINTKSVTFLSNLELHRVFPRIAHA